MLSSVLYLSSLVLASLRLISSPEYSQTSSPLVNLRVDTTPLPFPSMSTTLRPLSSLLRSFSEISSNSSD